MGVTNGYKDVVATYTTSGNVGDTLRFRWSQTGQNVSGNYTDINWYLELISGAAGYISSSASKSWSVTIDGQAFSGTNTVGIGNNTTKTLASGTKRIYHGNDGKKSFSVSFSQVFNINFNTWVGTVSGSGSWTLNDIPRATTPSVSPANVTMGNTLTINLPRASSSFTHTLYHDFQVGNWTQFATGAGTFATLAIPASWAVKIPNAASASGKIRCLTYHGSTLIGEKVVSFTATVPASVVPIVSGIEVTEAVSGLAAKFGAFIRSTINSYKVETLGLTYTGADITTDFIQQSGKVTVKVTAIDSRGRQGTKTEECTVVEYYSPTIVSFLAFRADASGKEANGGTALKCLFHYKVAPCGNKNDKSYKIEYKRDTATAWISVANGNTQYTLEDGSLKEGILGLEYSYNVRLTVTDYFGSATYEVRVGSEIVPICVHPSGKGLGIGGYPTKEALQIFFSVIELMNADGSGKHIDLVNEIKTLRAGITELNSNLLNTSNGLNEIKNLNNASLTSSEGRFVGMYGTEKVYEKLFEGNMSRFVSSSTIQTLDFNISMPGVKRILGAVSVKFGDWDSPYCDANGKIMTCLGQIYSTMLRFRNMETWGSAYAWKVILRYTK